MSTKHKHYKWIVAWAEGKQMQEKISGTSVWVNVTYPDWDPDTEYRTRPEPRTIWVNEFDGDLAGANWNTKEDAERNITYGEVDRRAIEFVEVLK